VDSALAVGAMRLLRSLLQQQLCPMTTEDGTMPTPREQRGDLYGPVSWRCFVLNTCMLYSIVAEL
jgi:hypothetical protein